MSLNLKNPDVQALTDSIIEEQRAKVSVVTVGQFSPLAQALLTLCRNAFLERGVQSAPASDIFKWILGYLNLIGSPTLKGQFLNEIPNQRSLGRHLSAAANDPKNKVGIAAKQDKYGNRRHYTFKAESSHSSLLTAAAAAKNIQLLATGKPVPADT